MPGVDPDARFVDPGRHRVFDAAGEEGPHALDRVTYRLADLVEQAERADVVDDRCPRVQGRFGDGGLRGVDRDRDLDVIQTGDDTQDTVDLRLSGDAVRSRPGRFASDIEVGRAFIDQQARRSIAASGAKYRPPSEKESGVALTTPITSTFASGPRAIRSLLMPTPIIPAG